MKPSRSVACIIIIFTIIIILIIIIIIIINLIVLHLGGHHTEELGELDHPVPILVKLVDQVLKMMKAGFERKIKKRSSSIFPMLISKD